MKKLTIITGKQFSGKSEELKKIYKQRDPGTAVLIEDGRSFPYYTGEYGDTPEMIEVILIDNFPAAKIHELFEIVTTPKMKLLEKYKHAVEIDTPELIVVIDEKEMRKIPVGEGLKRRANIFEKIENRPLRKHVTAFNLKYLQRLDFIEVLIFIGHQETGNKFSITWHGSAGYISSIEISCEGNQPEATNIIPIEKFINKNRTYKSKMATLYHSVENGIEIEIN